MSYIDPSMLPMLDTFIYETTTLLDQLDEILLTCEKTKSISDEHINEIFRIMHTTKGSAAMMGLDGISTLAHKVEDIFFIIRENPAKMASVSDSIFDLVFRASDYFKNEIDALQSDDYVPGDQGDMVELLEEQIAIIKGEAPAKVAKVDETVQEPVQAEPVPTDEVATEVAESATAPVATDDTSNESHSVRVFFEDGCQMENIRAFMLITQLKDYCIDVDSIPANPENDSSLCSSIVQHGIIINFVPDGSPDEVFRAIENALNVRSYEILDANGVAPVKQVQEVKPQVTDTNEIHTVKVFFEDGCQMENLRAFMLLEQIKDYCDVISTDPVDPDKNSDCTSIIVKNG
ncbi:MAG: Hpt domain-containing protein, partial [Oscillospiraceae bacterium]